MLASDDTAVLDESDGAWRYWSGEGVVSARVGAFNDASRLPFVSGKRCV